MRTPFRGRSSHGADPPCSRTGPGEGCAGQSRRPSPVPVPRGPASCVVGFPGRVAFPPLPSRAAWEWACACVRACGSEGAHAAARGSAVFSRRAPRVRTRAPRSPAGGRGLFGAVRQGAPVDRRAADSCAHPVVSGGCRGGGRAPRALSVQPCPKAPASPAAPRGAPAAPPCQCVAGPASSRDGASGCARAPLCEFEARF